MDPAADGASPEPNTDPNPMQTEENDSVFDDVMSQIEDNDGMDEHIITKATGSEDVRPDPDPEPAANPEEDEEQAAQGDDPEGEKPDDPDAPPEQDSKDRLAKLAKRGRETGRGRYELEQQRTDFARSQAEFQAEREAFQAERQQFGTLMQEFQHNPIEVAKAHGVDAAKLGQRVKQLLENPEKVHSNDETAALRTEVQELRQLLTTNQQETQQRQDAQTRAAAAEEGHTELKVHMAQDAAKKAYPLASKLPEATFRQYSSNAVDAIIAFNKKNRLPPNYNLGYDSICEVIEDSLEAMRPVYGDSPPPATERRAAPTGGTPTGQRSAPSIGNGEKTSSSAGPNWDALSLGDDDDDFVKKIQQEVASSG